MLVPKASRALHEELAVINQTKHAAGSAAMRMGDELEGFCSKHAQ